MPLQIYANIWIGIYLDQRIFCQAKNVLGNFFAWQMQSIANFRLTKYSLVKIYANPIICQYKYMPIQIYANQNIPLSQYSPKPLYSPSLKHISDPELFKFFCILYPFYSGKKKRFSKKKISIL
jgi:hypothetical protein